VGRKRTASAYLAAYRSEVASPPATRGRNLRAIRRKLAQGHRPEVAAPRSEPSRVVDAPHSRWAAGVLVAKSIGLSVALGVTGLGALGLGAHALSRPEPPSIRVPAAASPSEASPSPGSEVRASRAPARPPEPPPTPIELASQPATSPPVPARRPKAIRDASAPPAASTSADRLAEELGLMRAAERALAAGRFAEVLQQLSAHERDFPQGALVEERRAWQTVARCNLGEDSATEQARAFVRRHPATPLARKVTSACELDIEETDSSASPDEGT
jgi:hypothetical protein